MYETIQELKSIIKTIEEIYLDQNQETKEVLRAVKKETTGYLTILLLFDMKEEKRFIEQLGADELEKLTKENEETLNKIDKKTWLKDADNFAKAVKKEL